ncbi:class I SAM-dependent methyltransferase [Streptomyces antimycoticus]|uniref:class I SAM-dependent methyltransferase n=1 Tax=Streptomyces antimycoticus TaxID=68175 RepID=UPI0033F8B649|nr:class I SAM-dependent methyltransferase [Streptomyces antimycoticus]WTA86840.1 class I SAM-dependent methyltransferase [Streptomyces antimycoticus]
MPDDNGRPPFQSGDLDTVRDQLRSHPAVEQADVRLAAGGSLTAYVVPAHSPQGDAAGVAGGVVPPDTETVDNWRSVFDDCYRGTRITTTGADTGNRPEPERSAASETELTAGWTDSFTGRPIPADDMAEWVATTVARILALEPTCLLEMGAGTGLLMSDLTAQGELREYTATDLSPESVRVLTTVAARLRRTRPAPLSLAVHEARATTPAPPSLHGGYDVAVLNSVAQYFPSTRYLEDVLHRIVPVMRPGGHIFLGDLRNEDLFEEFACIKHHRRATPGTPPQRIARQITRELRRDGELLLSPGYLHGLPARLGAITAVETAPRRGAACNEMTLFRYDAVLHVGCEAPATEPDWHDGTKLTLPVLAHQLACETGAFGYRSLVNARLRDAQRLRRTYLPEHSAPASAEAVALDPEEVCTLAEGYGWTPRLRWTPGADCGEFDLWLAPPDGTCEHFRFAIPWQDPDPGQDLGASPRHRMFPPRAEHDRKTELTSFLTRRLPERLVPCDMVFTERLPCLAGHSHR